MAASALYLDARRAADLMAHNPISVRASATVADTLQALTGRGQHAAPVIDDGGRAVGVLSRSDLLIHERECLHSPTARTTPDPTRASDLMTPAVFSVAPATPADKVVEQLLSFGVHQLFVVDDDGVPVGVITAHDVLRHLRA